MNQTRKEKARLRSEKHRAKRKTEVQELKREDEKLKNVLEYLRANAPDHWLAVQPILHRETTKPTNDLVESKNLLWDEDLFADAMLNADCDKRTSRGVRTLFNQSERGYGVRHGAYVRCFNQSEHEYSVRHGENVRFSTN